MVRRIIREYAAGESPRAIAARLNVEGVPGPNGREWGDTTIRGQVARGTGILNNALYIGRLAWNRCSYVKDPRTGKRLARPNPPEEWETFEVPHLRILDDDLWDRVKSQQEGVRTEMGRDGAGTPLNRAHRYLLSGLIRCGECGSPYVIVNGSQYGCNRSKGTCANDLRARRDEIEGRLLEGLRHRLMQPARLERFLTIAKANLECQARDGNRERAAMERKLRDVERKRSNILRAVEDGLYRREMKARLAELDTTEAGLRNAIAALVTDPAVPSAEWPVALAVGVGTRRQPPAGGRPRLPAAAQGEHDGDDARGLQPAPAEAFRWKSSLPWVSARVRNTKSPCGDASAGAFDLVAGRGFEPL
ncbi:hypothetical protein HL658_20270, partial [Azospirillum sp. RWY-5-1]|nr:hypothetical protein [Azospirillum oleiclasticum]NYZ22126.1 hypothetical protein [Azospirillum oleiclasticum]